MRMFRASMYAMNRSENVCSSWSRRTICRFGIVRTVVAVTAVAVSIRKGPLTEEVARSEHPDNGLSARLRQHGELHGAFLNVEASRGRIGVGACAASSGSSVERGDPGRGG